MGPKLDEKLEIFVNWVMGYGLWDMRYGIWVMGYGI
jgi:hypothetical protein